MWITIFIKELNSKSYDEYKIRTIATSGYSFVIPSDFYVASNNRFYNR